MPKSIAEHPWFKDISSRITISAYCHILEAECVAVKTIESFQVEQISVIKESLAPYHEFLIAKVTGHGLGPDYSPASIYVAVERSARSSYPRKGLIPLLAGSFSSNFTGPAVDEIQVLETKDGSGRSQGDEEVICLNMPPKNPLFFYEFAFLAFMVGRHRPNYALVATNCFWFVAAVVEVLKEVKQVPCNYNNQDEKCPFSILKIFGGGVKVNHEDVKEITRMFRDKSTAFLAKARSAEEMARKAAITDNLREEMEEMVNKEARTKEEMREMANEAARAKEKVKLLEARLKAHEQGGGSRR